MGILGYFLVVVSVLGEGAERRGRGGKGGGGEGRRRQTRIKKDRFTFMLGMI